jgi:hypothetical protein
MWGHFIDGREPETGARAVPTHEGDNNKRSHPDHGVPVTGPDCPCLPLICARFSRQTRDARVRKLT